MLSNFSIFFHCQNIFSVGEAINRSVCIDYQPIFVFWIWFLLPINFGDYSLIINRLSLSEVTDKCCIAGKVILGRDRVTERRASLLPRPAGAIRAEGTANQCPCHPWRRRWCLRLQADFFQSSICTSVRFSNRIELTTLRGSCLAATGLLLLGEYADVAIRPSQSLQIIFRI